MDILTVIFAFTTGILLIISILTSIRCSNLDKQSEDLSNIKHQNRILQEYVEELNLTIKDKNKAIRSLSNEVKIVKAVRGSLTKSQVDDIIIEKTVLERKYSKLLIVNEELQDLLVKIEDQEKLKAEKFNVIDELMKE